MKLNGARSQSVVIFYDESASPDFGAPAVIVRSGQDECSRTIFDQGAAAHDLSGKIGIKAVRINRTTRTKQ